MDSNFLVVWLLFAYSGIILARRALKSWLNPVTVYLGIWTGSIMIGLLYFSDSSLLPETWIAIIIAALTFTLVALVIASLFVPIGINRIADKKLYTGSNTRQVQVFAVKRLQVVFASCIVLELIRLYIQVQKLVDIGGSLDAVLNYGGDLRLSLVLESAKEQIEVTGSFATRLFSYLISMGGISLFLGAYLLRVGKGIGVLPLVVEALISVAGLQRYQFLVALLIFVWSYWYFKYIPIDQFRIGRQLRVKGSDGKQLWILVITAAILTIVTWQVIMFRHPGMALKGAIEHSLSYFSMPVWALDVRIRYNYPLHGGMTYGASTFWGLAVWIKRLGFDIHLPPYHYEPVALPGGRLTNVFTYLVNALDDWGWFGLVLLPAAISGISVFLHLGIVRYKKTFWVPMQAVMMATITMSFYTLVTKELYYILLLIGFAMLIPFLGCKVRTPLSLNPR